jgi:hypothetical protein
MKQPRSNLLHYLRGTYPSLVHLNFCSFYARTCVIPGRHLCGLCDTHNLRTYLIGVLQVTKTHLFLENLAREQSAKGTAIPFTEAHDCLPLLSLSLPLNDLPYNSRRSSPFKIKTVQSILLVGGQPLDLLTYAPINTRNLDVLNNPLIVRYIIPGFHCFECWRTTQSNDSHMRYVS